MRGTALARMDWEKQTARVADLAETEARAAAAAEAEAEAEMMAALVANESGESA